MKEYFSAVKTKLKEGEIVAEHKAESLVDQEKTQIILNNL